MMTSPETEPTWTAWPVLDYAEWKDTCETLHLWLQILGKVKLELCPFLNQWWEVALHLSARGVTSGPIPQGNRTFDVEFDFIDHHVVLRSSDGRRSTVPLEPVSVAEFYKRFMAALDSVGVQVAISTTPSEIANPTPFERDDRHAAYDRDYVHRWWQVLLATERVINRFRTPFHGKSSPVNLFWGGLDLSYTRFNGEPAEIKPGADRLMRYGENEANFAVGFWPGGEGADAVFYAYMTPPPPGVENAAIEPKTAQYAAPMGEFVLPYDAARREESPDETVLTFFQTTYEACAQLAGWNRSALEGNVPRLRRS